MAVSEEHVPWLCPNLPTMQQPLQRAQSTAHAAGGGLRHIPPNFPLLCRAALIEETMQRERLLKVLVVGDLGVGKTAIIRRYVQQVFSHHYRATIGVDFALKVLHWDPGTVIRLQLWDIAGKRHIWTHSSSSHTIQL